MRRISVANPGGTNVCSWNAVYRLVPGPRPVGPRPGARRRCAQERGSRSRAADRRAGPQAADGPVEDRFAPGWGEWQRPEGGERRQLRRVQGQPLPEAARPTGPEGRYEGHDGGDVGEAAPAGDRGGLRPGSLRPRPEG